MNRENDINEELQQLLDALEQHGKNARRQKRLGELIDSLEASGTSLRGRHDRSNPAKTETGLLRYTRNDAKRRKLYPLWWAVGAAAACLLLWLLVKPNAKQQPEMEQEILVETTKTVDTVKTEVNDVVIEQPVANEAILAEETSVAPQNTPMKKEKPKTQIIEEVVEQPVLAEVKPTEPEDTTNVVSNTIPTENETPSAVQKPQRRVIRSLNLVCYECQKDPEIDIKPVLEDRTLFGQPQDPNMRNGSLAFEIKLN